jgi:glutamate synthase (NADPH/NADH) small chain
MRVERLAPRTLPREERKLFDEVVRNFSYAEALFEARRCLYCYDAPCIQGCPAGVNVPEFISRIKSENILGAARIIYSANPFGSICGRVCPTEALCEKACTSKLLNAPVAIGHLQRFACDFALDREKVQFAYPSADKGAVAVVGGGPAGLSCAHFLRLLGYEVCLFEKEEALGGLPVYGIPGYRLPKATALREIDLIAPGFEREEAVITSSSAQEILNSFQAVFLATGSGVPAQLNVPGEHLEGVFSANLFLKEVALGKFDRFSFPGKEVGIFGAGASAMDAARMSLRLGADRVTVIYRRSKEEMPAFPSEYEGTEEEGVQFLWLAAPKEIRRVNGRLEVLLERMKLGAPDSDGRRRPEGTGQYFSMQFGALIKAIASVPDKEALSIWPGLELSKSGYPLHDNGRSTNPKIFLGGDLIGAGTVVQAVADGKNAALKIDQWLKKGGA